MRKRPFGRFFVKHVQATAHSGTGAITAEVHLLALEDEESSQLGAELRFQPRNKFTLEYCFKRLGRNMVVPLGRSTKRKKP